MRTIPDPGFANDDGAADPALAETLAGWSGGSSPTTAVLAELRRARLLVPVVAILDQAEHDEHGLVHDKSSDMAAVLMRGVDGRVALLAFTSSATLARWNPEARPVPVEAPLAAKAAVQDDAAALVVDVAGPVTFVVEGEDLSALAAGWRLARVGDRTAWIGPVPQ